MTDDRTPVSLSEHEHELRDSLAKVPERDAADWATSSLAVVIDRTTREG